MCYRCFRDKEEQVEIERQRAYESSLEIEAEDIEKMRQLEYIIEPFEEVK